MYFFSNLEAVYCSMSSSNCCFLTYIQISQETDKVVWYSHPFKNFKSWLSITPSKYLGFINIILPLTALWVGYAQAHESPGILLKWLWSTGLRRSLRFFISTQLPGDVDAAGPRTTLWGAVCYFMYIIDVEVEFLKGHISCAWLRLNNRTRIQTKACGL